MAFGSLQAWPKRLRGGLALALVAGALAGCQSRDPSSTGSIARGTESELRGNAEGLARRYEQNPSNPEAALDYAGTLRGLGQNAQALAVLQQAALKNPTHTGLLAAYGKVLADIGRFKEAETVLANAHRPDRPDWRILSVQGVVADQLGQFENAQRYYAAALKIVPGEPSVMANQGLSFALVKRLDEAERILQEAVRHPRADARVRKNLALVLGLRGRFAEAEALLARDMPPEKMKETLAGVRGMVRQPNSWQAIKQSDGAGVPVEGRPVSASGGDTSPRKLDAKRTVPRPAAL